MTFSNDPREFIRNTIVFRDYPTVPSRNLNSVAPPSPNVFFFTGLHNTYFVSVPIPMREFTPHFTSRAPPVGSRVLFGTTVPLIRTVNLSAPELQNNTADTRLHRSASRSRPFGFLSRFIIARVERWTRKYDPRVSVEELSVFSVRLSENDTVFSP